MLLLLNMIMVSIHALTWRATVALMYMRNMLLVSIHALTWRATYDSRTIIYNFFSFNPRPHMEGDIVNFQLIFHKISFNPRPHMEGD